MIRKLSEPEFIGKFPIRSEIEVLPADEKRAESIGFNFHVREGTEVESLDGEILTSRDDIKEGMEVIVTTLVGRMKMRVVKDGSEFRAEVGSTVANLEFGKDDRNCWISTYAMNTRGLKNLKLEK